MTRRVRNILKGAGSILDIAPQGNYRAIIAKESTATRIEKHWVNTGRHLRSAMDKFAHEQEKKNP